MLKLAPFAKALSLSAYPGADAWYDSDDDIIYLGCASPRFILEILSHEVIHKVLRGLTLSPEASKGIDRILWSHGHILPRGGL